jgi:rRNA-processing protein EBP2
MCLFSSLVDHMAKVKDKLIFETKKMDAVAQRKSNKEQKLRAKESQSNKVQEKAKRKRDHFQEVEEWANSAAKNRGSALKDDDDDRYLNRGPGKKRQFADKKYGFGGKNGRFKQNDRASMNDTSDYNPRGNFPGGMKRTGGKPKGGAGAGRQGKRARDAGRSRK